MFNPVTDFLGLWRSTGPNVVKLEIPGLDYVIEALARAGIVTVTVSATAPVANQSTTAWLKAAVPSYSAEGVFYLWDKISTQYLPATSALFLQLLEASAGENGVSWWTTTGGPPLNTVGNNGDYAIRTDAPGGVYGPKAAGAWPAAPLPGTVDAVTSTTLDNTFGTTEGQLIYRGPAVWQALPIGTEDMLLTTLGGIPAWDALSSLMDVVFGAVQGSILYRDAGVWNDLPPGVANQVMTTNGPAANPSWTNRVAEFPSGTVMLFQQSAAPPGWTKQVALNDYGLRVVNGAVGSTAGSPFSSVFAQTAVGNTTLSAAQIPQHTHGAVGSGTVSVLAQSISVALQNGGQTTDGGTGGSGSHTHSVNLTLSYVDVIIATKN